MERDGDPNKYPAKVQFVANDCDLALITVPAPDFFKNMLPLKFGGIPALESTVSAYGYPIGGERMSVTTGIVSRIDFQLYTHSSIDQHLAIQISAQINPGNSGGPVMQNGKVVGVAFQGYSGDVAQGVAYMIPTPVIKRFLKDISDGHYDEYPDLAITYAKLQNPAQRKFLGLKDDDRGVLVGTVVAAGPSDGILQPGDVLLAIDGHPIASDANVELEGERVAVRGSRRAKIQGRTVKFDILRDKQPMTVTIKLVQAVAVLDSGPQLRCASALRPLRRPAFSTVKPGHARSVSASRSARSGISSNISSSTRFTLSIPMSSCSTNILPDPINTYLAPYRGGIVDEVNGKKIRTLDELAKAFAEPPERLVIEMIGDGPPLVLDRKQVEAARERIKTRYNVLKEQNLEEQPASRRGPKQAEQNLTMPSTLFITLALVLFAAGWGAGEEGIRRSCARCSQAKTAGARPRKRDRPGLRLFSAVAKESAVFKARARRGLVQRPRPGDGGPGCKPELRGARARRVRRKNRGQRRGDRLRSESRVARTSGKNVSRRNHAARNRA